MTPARRRLGLAILAVASLAACRTAPIQSQLDGEFLGRGSIATRGEQIRSAAAQLGWQTQQLDPRTVRATLNLRSHQAVVDIPFDQNRFLIRYAASTNLNYDGTNIHQNYNGWVNNLRNAIVARSGA